MRTTFAFIALSIALVSLQGCGNTADGASKDAKNAGAVIEKNANDAAAAISLTPAIKSALIANPFLNEDGNLIDVDSTPEKVTLSGHVKKESYRALADEIARKILRDKQSYVLLQNDIKVVAP